MICELFMAFKSHKAEVLGCYKLLLIVSERIGGFSTL